MITKAISLDIVHYLIEKRGYSLKEAADALGTSKSHIRQIQKKKEALSPENFQILLKNLNMRFFEFAVEAINLDHLPEESRKKILLCKELSDHIKKKKH